MRQVRDNPTSNFSISTVPTFAFSSTGASGTVNASVSVASLQRGQSVFIDITSSAGGYVKATKEYFIIPVDGTTVRLASTYANALNDVPDLTASGDAGTGTLYPTYDVGGALFVGSDGNINIRGLNSSVFSIHKNITGGSLLPFMVKDINASGTTASDFVAWND